MSPDVHKALMIVLGSAPLAAQLGSPPARVQPCDEGVRLLFADLHELLPPLLPATSAAAGDVDGDGDPDLFLSAGMQWMPHQLVLWLNQEGRLRTDASALPMVAGTESDVPALADLDADGDLDVSYGATVLTNDGRGHFSVALQPRRPQPTPGRTATTPSAATPGLAWTTFDLDRDGDLDALGLRATWEVGGYGSVAFVRNELLLNDGSGILLPATLVTEELPHVDHITAATLADVDGDGALDAVRADVNWRLHVSFGDGRGRFSPARPLSSFATPHIPQALEAGDFDGDGDEDLLVVGNDRDGRSLTLWRMGALEPAPEPLPTYGEALDVGDFDADGDLDLLVGNERTSWSEDLLRNDGSGHFTLEPSFPALSTDARAVHLADLEGDGDLDAWIAATPPRVLRNEGAAWLELATGLSALSARGLAPGDLDGDGDLDLVVSDGLAVFRSWNLGAAGFAPPERLPIAGTRLTLLDVDLDGDLDGFASSEAGVTEALENDGHGRLSLAAWRVPLSFDRADLGDVDLDGDLDVLGRDGLFVALARELAWRTLPKLGRVLELELHGPPATPWILLAAPQRAPRDLWTARGPLRLLPASTQRAASGRFCASGTTLVTFAVPADPTLVGQSLHWQAAVGAPLRLTNVDSTLLSGF